MRWLTNYQLAILILSARLAAAAEPGNRLVGNELFADRPIPRIAITIAEPELQKLRVQNRNYVSATVTVDDRVFKDVAVRLKGRGSFRPLDDKPSFAVKFDEFVPRQKLFGLSKIMLNNSSQDTSLLSEYLATGLFRDAGVPAARVTHARVSLNGRPLGFYVLIDAMNKAFLKGHFKNATGNLYEGYAKDIDQTLEHDGGPPGDQSDLRALLAAARLPESERAAGLPQHLNDQGHMDSGEASLKFDLLEGIDSAELIKRIREKFWPGLTTGQVLPSIYGFLKMGRLKKDKKGRWTLP